MKLKLLAVLLATASSVSAMDLEVLAEVCVNKSNFQTSNDEKNNKRKRDVNSFKTVSSGPVRSTKKNKRVLTIPRVKMVFDWKTKQITQKESQKINGVEGNVFAHTVKKMIAAGLMKDDLFERYGLIDVSEEQYFFEDLFILTSVRHK